MKWHRVLFWLIFLLFFAITIGFEGGGLRREGLLKFAVFVALTAIGIVAVDRLLVPRFLQIRRYVAFVLGVIAIVIIAVVAEAGIEALALAVHPLGWGYKLEENAMFIAPWIGLAVCLFIAENMGRTTLQKTRTELEYLKHQVNPHFLLNTHNNIYFLIEQNPELAANTLLKLSGVMQYMLYECSGDRVSLQREFELLRNYIDLELIRKSEHLQVDCNLHSLQPDCLIAPLLLITFVENAFTHLSNFKDKPNFIRISATVENGELLFSVTNTKSGNRGENRTSGIGLKNVRQRLGLLYRNKHTLNVHEQEDTFSIKLSIRLS